MPQSVWLGLYHGLSRKLKFKWITSKEIKANSPLVWQQMWEYFLWTLRNNNTFLNSCTEHEDCTETHKLVYPESIDRSVSRAGIFNGSLGQRGELLSTLGCKEHGATANSWVPEEQIRRSKQLVTMTQVLTAKMFWGHLLHTSSIFGPDDWKPISCWAHEMRSWRVTSGLVASLKHIDPTQPFQQSNQMGGTGKTEICFKSVSLL